MRLNCNEIGQFGQFKIINIVATRSHFYTRKQLQLSARLSHRNSVCLSVCLSHGWISQKRCKLKLPSLHRRLPGRL